MARINLFRYMKNIGYDKIIYCDTDSIICKSQFNSSDNSTLGSLKKENSKPIVKVMILGAKLYYYEYDDGSYDFRMKGVKKQSDMLQTKDQIVQLFRDFISEGKIQVMNPDSFQRLVGGVQIRSLLKSLYTLNRRKFMTVTQSIPFMNKNEYISTL